MKTTSSKSKPSILKISRVLSTVPAIVAAMLATSCGRQTPDFFVLVDDVRGVKPKTEVCGGEHRSAKFRRCSSKKGAFTLRCASILNIETKFAPMRQ